MRGRDRHPFSHTVRAENESVMWCLCVCVYSVKSARVVCRWQICGWRVNGAAMNLGLSEYVMGKLGLVNAHILNAIKLDDLFL